MTPPPAATLPELTPAPDPHRPPGRARQRRQLGIIAAARDVILAQGYEAATMEQIAAAAGITKKTLYNHFESKEALLTAVLETLADQLGDSLHDEGHLQRDLVDGLQRWGRQFVAAMALPPGLDVYRLAITLSRRHPQVGRALYTSALAQLMGALAQYIDTRAGPPGIADPLQLARQLTGSLSFLVQAALLGADIDLADPETERYIHDAVHAALAGAGWQPTAALTPGGGP